MCYIDNEDENFIINGIFLTKIKKTHHDFKTIIDDNSNEENELLRQNKKYFDDTIRIEFPKLIQAYTEKFRQDDISHIQLKDCYFTTIM